MWRLSHNHSLCRIPSSKIHLGFGSQIRNGQSTIRKIITPMNTKSTTFMNRISIVNKNTKSLLLYRSFADARALPPPSNGPSKRKKFKLPNFNFNFKMPDFGKFRFQDSMLWKLKGVLLGISAAGLTVYYAGGIIFFLSKFVVVGAVGLFGASAAAEALTRFWAGTILNNSYHLLSINKARIEKEIGSPFEIPTEVGDFELKRTKSPRRSPITGNPDYIIQLSAMLRGENAFGQLVISGTKATELNPTEIYLELYTPEGLRKIPLYDYQPTHDILEVKPKGKAVFVQRAPQDDNQKPDMLEQLLASRPIKSAKELVKKEITRSKRLQQNAEKGWDILVGMDDEVEQILEILPPHVKEYYRQQEEAEKMKKLSEEIQKRKQTSRKLY